VSGTSSALAGRSATAIDEGQHAKEDANGRQQQNQDAVTECSAARGTGRGGLLVTHGAALGGNAGNVKHQNKCAQNRDDCGLKGAVRADERPKRRPTAKLSPPIDGNSVSKGDSVMSGRLNCFGPRRGELRGFTPNDVMRRHDPLFSPLRQE